MMENSQNKSRNRRRRIPLTYYLSLLSISMTGNVSSSTQRTSQKPSNNYGLNSITPDGPFGKFTTLNTKDKELLDILQTISKTDTSETSTTSENTALPYMVFTVLRETTKSMVSGCGEELRSLKNGRNIKATTTSLSRSWTPKTRLFKI